MEQGIRRWLESLGLGELVGVFEENRITADILPTISNDDLKDMGVNALGDRRRILQAIAKLNETDHTTSSDAETTGFKPNASAAERRQLTVMFCDLVGSTALSQQLEPEDLRDVLRQYQDAVAGSVARYEGHIAKFMGDGVLAYFGWPQAFEDQAERAVRAGQDAVQAVANIGIDQISGLQARVGIATGTVVVGDLVGKTSLDAEAVTGETPNLAARLQAIAEPGQVIIDRLSYRLIRPVFEAAPLGAIGLKGFSDRMEAWCVMNEIKTDSRFEARHDQGLNPLIGRENELRLMLERWAQASASEGQALLLSGEAGIGKSRLIRALRDGISEEPHFCLRYQCSPHHANTALFPIIQRLERAAGFDKNDSVARRLDKLEELLRLATPNIDQVAPLIAGLLSLDGDDRYGTLDLTAPQRRDRLIEALLSQVIQLSDQRPILFLLEDAHWIDSTTEALIEAVIARMANQRVFVVLSHRPGYDPPWLAHPHVTSISLNRLGRQQGLQIAKTCGGDKLSAETIQSILTRADGVPLFVEELTKSLAEAGGQFSDKTIPETLLASMTARLDRLGNAKTLAQVGAIIGREFQYSMVVALSGLVEWKAEEALKRLVHSGLVFQQGTPPSAKFQFKHALIQDAAYDSVLPRRRRQLHGEFANLLKDKFHNTADFEPELLAHHWEQSGDLAQAIHYRVLAAERANRSSALWDAIFHFGKALSLIDRLPDTQGSRQQYLDTVVGLFSVQGMTWSTEEEMAEALTQLEKALSIAHEVEDLRAAAFLETWRSYYWADEEGLATAMAHAEASGDDVALAHSVAWEATFLGYVGRYEQSLANIERVIEIKTRLNDQSSLAMSFAGVARCFNARAGRLSYSLELAAQAREISKKVNDTQLKSWLSMEAEPLMYMGDWPRVVKVVEKDLPAALKIGNWFVATYVCSWAAFAYLKMRRVEDARRMIDQGGECLAEASTDSQLATYLPIMRSSVRLQEGDITGALRDAEAGRISAEKNSYMLELGAARRALGDTYAAAGDQELAHENFGASLDVLRSIQCQPELAQSLLAYGRFSCKGDHEGGQRLLDRALVLFEEIGAEGWVSETKAALSG